MNKLGSLFKDQYFYLFLLDERLLVLFTFWLKHFIDCLIGLSYNISRSNISRNVYFVFNYFIAYNV